MGEEGKVTHSVTLHIITKGLLLEECEESFTCPFCSSL